MVVWEEDHLVISSTASAEFGEEACETRVLMSSPLMTVLLTGFLSGQVLDGVPDADVALAVLDGGGVLAMNGTCRRIRVGDVAVLPGGTSNIIEADPGGMILLQMVASSGLHRGGPALAALGRFASWRSAARQSRR